jgi:hypothetical protein
VFCSGWTPADRMGVPPYAVAKEDDVLRFLSSWPLRSLQRLVSSGKRPSVLLPPGYDLEQTAQLLLRQELGALEAEKLLREQWVHKAQAALSKDQDDLASWRLDATISDLELVLAELRRLQGEAGSQEVRALLSQVRVVPAREASGEEAVYVIPLEALGTVEPLAERLEDCAYLLHLEPEEVQAALSASSATDRSSP